MSDADKQAKLAEVRARIEEKKIQLEALREQRKISSPNTVQILATDPLPALPLPTSNIQIDSIDLSNNASQMPIGKRSAHFPTSHPTHKPKHPSVAGEASVDTSVQLEQWSNEHYNPSVTPCYYGRHHYPYQHYPNPCQFPPDQDDFDNNDSNITSGATTKSPATHSFKSRSLCTSWPNCRFNDNCHFSHPRVENVALTFLDTQLYGSLQSVALTLAIIRVVTAAMDEFSSHLESYGKPSDKYSHFAPKLPSLSITQFPSSSENNNDTSTNNANFYQHVIHQINTTSSHVPLISFLFDKLRQLEQFKNLKSDVLSLMCGLPTINSVIAVNNQRSKNITLQTQTTPTSSNSIEILPVTCFSKNLSEVASVASTNSTMYIIPTTPDPSAAVFGSTALSSTPIPEYRVHILPSLHYQKLFEKSFQLITTTNCKSFFLAHCPNPYYDPLYFNSILKSNNQTSINHDRSMERMNLEEPLFNKQRRQLEENPQFRVNPVNFVHGGRIVQKTNVLNDKSQAYDNDLITIPSKIKSSSSSLPPKYQNMKPYVVYRNPNVFYTFDQIIQQRYGAQISLADRMAQRASQNGFGESRDGRDVMNKYRLTQAFMPSTIAKPFTYFKPYSLTTMQKSASCNASIMPNVVKPYHQYNGEDDWTEGSIPNSSPFFPSHDGGQWPLQPQQQPLQLSEEDQRLMIMYSKSHLWLERSGWTPGQSLGDSNSRNITKPIESIVRPERYGLGNVDDNDDSS